MHRLRLHPARRTQTGLTLVELMVSLMLSLLLLAGVVQLFVANKTTYRTQEGLARLQESGRFAMHELTRSLRSAGYFGCSNLALAPPQVSTSSAPVDTDLDLDLSGPVIGEEDRVVGLEHGVDTMPSYSGAGDVLTLTGAGASGVGFTGDVTSVSGPVEVEEGFFKFTSNDFVLITDCEGTDFFDASGGVSVNASTEEATITLGTALKKEYAADALVMKAFSYSYFVADTGRDNAQGQNIFALFRRDNFAGTNTELIEGVSDMQVTYGVNVNSTEPIAQAYVAADQVTDWGDVVAVRIALLVDSIEGVLDVPAGYNYNGATVAATAGDFRMRQEFIVMSTLRNVVL